MVNVAVVLSGCGHLDGAEIHEAVLTTYFLERGGAQVLFCAPDVDQMHVVNHLTGEVQEGARRNVLEESARIARGNVTSVEEVNVDELDALVLPGGFGAAKNLSSFATEGTGCSVHPGVAALVVEAHRAGLPIGAICIAPAVIAKVLGGEGVKLTVGDDSGTALALESMGARHEDRAVNEVTVDTALRIVSTPAYMLGPGITDIAVGIEALCKQVLAMVSQSQSQAVG